MAEKEEHFLINVIIIEGRHLAWTNMDSAVVIRVGDQKKCTTIRHGTDSPFFNEYFAFEFFTTFQNLMDKNITLTVIRPKTICRAKKNLGSVTLDLGTVWVQQDHQFFHKWAVISAPSDDLLGGVRAYIKLDICILRKGESPKLLNINEHETDEIEGNLLLPDGLTVERQKASYIFNIYKGENLSKLKYLDLKNTSNMDKDPPSSYVQVFFAGLIASTSLKKNTANPEWNESLILTELFPPLCQRIKIRLHYVDICHENTFSERHVSLRSISNDGEHGFLPTFGPNFLHFYGKGNNCEGHVGQVLLSFTTNLQPSELNLIKPLRTEAISPLVETTMWQSEMLLLYGVILNANLIDKKFNDKPISYQISLGNSENSKGNELGLNTKTPAMSPLTIGKQYWYLKYSQEKPCLFIQSACPDLRKRMYKTNTISKITEELKSRLDAIEGLFVKEEHQTSGEIIGNLILDLIDFLMSACRKYVDMNKILINENYETILDNQRRIVCVKEMEEIENQLNESYNPKMKKRSFSKLQDIFRRLELLEEEAQDCWPDVYVTMVSGNKRVGFHKLPAKHLVYSPVDEEKGKYCGQVQNLFLQATSNNPSNTHSVITSKLDIFLWLGLEKHKAACFRSFPSGFVPPDCLEANNLPPFLIAQEKHYFQCRVHIYQGKFLPGSDRSGLCDPFVRVVIGCGCRETSVSRATLNPVWDQTLTFKKLILYGTEDFIKNNPPLVVLEIFDKDECFRTEFIGRCNFKPLMKFKGEPYTGPKFPPKLSWYKIDKREESLGEILAVAELFEIAEDVGEGDQRPSKEITRIPTDIKPNMVQYRLEVIFWGVRDLQKINSVPITKPKIVIECGCLALHSDVISNVKKSLNFTQPHKKINLNFPDQEEYAPSICIKMFDCRSFGRYTLAGTQILSLKYILYQPLTLTERNKRFSEEDIKLHSIKSGLGYFKTRPVAIDCHTDDTDATIQQPTLREPRYKTLIKQVLGFKLFNKPQKQKNAPRKRKYKFRKLKHQETSQTETGTTDEDSQEQAKKDKKTKTKKRTRKLLDSSKERKAAKKSIGSQDGTTASSSEICTDDTCDKNKTGNSNKGETTSGTDQSSTSTANSKLKFGRRQKKRRKRNGTKKVRIVDNTSSADRRSLYEPKKKKPKRNVSTDKEKKKTTLKLERKPRKKETPKSNTQNESFYKRWLGGVFQGPRKSNRRIKRKKKTNSEEIDSVDCDWWTKYFASIEAGNIKVPNNTTEITNKCTLKIYQNELELQPEFESFADILRSFRMYQGKRTGDETVDEANITGVFKGALIVYRWSQTDHSDYVTEKGYSVNNGVFQNFFPNQPLRFVARVYCVKGINLRPKDGGGKSDPYIVITIAERMVINDKENYVPTQINPIFGRCFEINGTFPFDHSLTISVFDWDLSSKDDLIGETTVDIENRFYTRHRAHCGIANNYNQSGYCAWRDREKPSHILEKLCKNNNIDLPIYTENSVKINSKKFSPEQHEPLSVNIPETNFNRERLALYVLGRWEEIPLVGCCLVPEYVETRSLYHPEKPGIEQGKLQLWVDIFPCTDLPTPNQVNITPRKPVAYELRVIIWNTDDVILEEDDFFVGEKMSDIYVKGWLTEIKKSQCTDVHYRSMTGEGSFSWRFVFAFKYLSSENKIVISKKESVFAVDETVFKIPCKLTLQVWDNDTFSQDDFLGTVVLDLSRLPRGAPSSKKCTLANLAPDAPTINLFKTKRSRGWWPFRGTDHETNSETITGKVEVEFELLTAEEAEKNPAGLGRADPQGLRPPNRPSTSFSWFGNPLKAIKFLICKHYRWTTVKFLVLIIFLLGIAAAIYSLPKYALTKFLHLN